MKKSIKPQVPKMSVRVIHADGRKPSRWHKLKPFKLAVAIAGILATCACAEAQTTNAALVGTTNTPILNQVSTNVPAPAIPALSGVIGIIGNQLMDDIPYITNGNVSASMALLYNSSDPKGAGKVGFFGDVTFSTSKQSAIGIGGGVIAHHSFITPVALTLGTTITNLPTILGKWYAFASDGPLYDFTGKEVGNWTASGLFHNWTISPTVSIGIKAGIYDDSVIPGVGWFGALTGTF